MKRTTCVLLVVLMSLSLTAYGLEKPETEAGEAVRVMLPSAMITKKGRVSKTFV